MQEHFDKHHPRKISRLFVYRNLKQFCAHLCYNLHSPKNNEVVNRCLDSRNYIVWIRIDIPFTSDSGIKMTYTEYWDETGFYVWEHNGTKTADISNLGTPKQYASLS